MFCTNCGTQVSEGQKFCTNCGAALQSAEHPSQPSQAMDPNVTQKTPESTQVVAIAASYTDAKQFCQS